MSDANRELVLAVAVRHAAGGQRYRWGPGDIALVPDELDTASAERLIRDGKARWHVSAPAGGPRAAIFPRVADLHRAVQGVDRPGIEAAVDAYFEAGGSPGELFTALLADAKPNTAPAAPEDTGATDGGAPAAEPAGGAGPQGQSQPVPEGPWARVLAAAEAIPRLEPGNKAHWLADGKTPEVKALRELAQIPDLTAAERDEAYQYHLSNTPDTGAVPPEDQPSQQEA